MKLHLAWNWSNTQRARPFSPRGRRWPGVAGSDEGAPRAAESWKDVTDPHPTSLREATFSHAWEKDMRTKIPPSGGDAHA